MFRTTTKVATGIMLATALSLAPLVAGASDATSTTTTVAATTTTTTAHSVWVAFRAQWKAYVDGLKAINATYRSSVDSARSTYWSAMAVATTHQEKVTARVALDTALAAALTARATAITAAGSPPAPPAGYNGSTWILGFQTANEALRTAVASAQTAYAAALSAATTHAQRVAARETYRAAVFTAEAAHLNALVALGAPPKHPGKLA